MFQKALFCTLRLCDGRGVPWNLVCVCVWWWWCGGSKRYSGYILTIFLFSTSLLQIFWVLPAPLISTEGWYIGTKEVHAQNSYLVIINWQDPVRFYHPPQNTAIFFNKSTKKNNELYILVTYKWQNYISYNFYADHSPYYVPCRRVFSFYTHSGPRAKHMCSYCQSSFFWLKKSDYEQSL